jgi:hypothetical protein
MKYVLVTGGVVSGLGKGVTASSIGVLLKACGLRVTSIKIGNAPLSSPPQTPFPPPPPAVSPAPHIPPPFPHFYSGSEKREREENITSVFSFVMAPT